MNSKLTEFERSVLNMLLDGESPELAKLRLQLETAEIGRELTGAGFYLHFNGLNESDAISIPSCRIGDVFANLDGLEHGAGFVLFIENGRLKTLEAYSFEESWPASIGEFSLTYTSEDRKLPF